MYTVAEIKNKRSHNDTVVGVLRATVIIVMIGTRVVPTRLKRVRIRFRIIQQYGKRRRIIRERLLFSVTSRR